MMRNGYLQETIQPDVAQKLDQDFCATRLAKAIQQLSPEHREVVVLRYYENMKMQEIALAHRCFRRHGQVAASLCRALPRKTCARGNEPFFRRRHQPERDLMNCEQFNERLDEYLDESLDAAELALARAHAQGCVACQEALRRREAVANSVRFSLNRQTRGLSLSGEARRNIIAALQPREALPGVGESLRTIFRQRAWAMALILFAGLVIFGGYFYLQPQKNASPQAIVADDSRNCVIDIPFETETHVSRMENNMAVDAIVSSAGVLHASFSKSIRPSPSLKPRSENRTTVKT